MPDPPTVLPCSLVPNKEGENALPANSAAVSSSDPLTREAVCLASHGYNSPVDTFRRFLRINNLGRWTRFTEFQRTGLAQQIRVCFADDKWVEDHLALLRALPESYTPRRAGKMLAILAGLDALQIWFSEKAPLGYKRIEL